MWCTIGPANTRGSQTAEESPSIEIEFSMTDRCPRRGIVEERQLGVARAWLFLGILMTCILLSMCKETESRKLRSLVALKKYFEKKNH